MFLAAEPIFQTGGQILNSICPRWETRCWKVHQHWNEKPTLCRGGHKSTATAAVMYVWCAYLAVFMSETHVMSTAWVLGLIIAHSALMWQKIWILMPCKSWIHLLSNRAQHIQRLLRLGTCHSEMPEADFRMGRNLRQNQLISFWYRDWGMRGWQLNKATLSRA